MLQIQTEVLMFDHQNFTHRAMYSYSCFIVTVKAPSHVYEKRKKKGNIFPNDAIIFSVISESNAGCLKKKLQTNQLNE